MNNQESKIKIIENKQGFKVIKVSRKVLETATNQIRCVCDNCLASPESGYYVAVLNLWLCPTCYEHWISNAEHYAEDDWVEKRNYERYMKLFKQVESED